jgi:hypothetical protein
MRRCFNVLLPVAFTATTFAAATFAQTTAWPAEDCPCTQVGWHDDLQQDRGWQAEPWQVHTPSDKYSASFGTEGGTFSIGAPSGNMAWTRTVNPVWVKAFPFLVVEVANIGAEAGSPSVQFFLSDDSTGPITPAALNPENPLAGDHEVLLGPVTAAGQYVFDLTTQYPSDRVSRITVRLHGKGGAARVTLKNIEFLAADPRSPASQPTSRTACPDLFADQTRTQTNDGWTTVALPPDAAVSARCLSDVFDIGAAWQADRTIQLDGLAFQLGTADRAAVATGLMEAEAPAIAGRWQGRTLALLMGSRAFGSDAPWYSGASTRTRANIRSPHQVAIRLEYADGTRQSHFPWSVRRKQYTIEAAPQPYVVPLDPDKTLVRFSIDERMSYGQVFVLAASVGKAAPQPGWPELSPANVVAAPSPTAPPSTAARWSRDGDVLTIENNSLAMELDLAAGLSIQRLDLQPFHRRLLASSTLGFIEVRDANGRACPLQIKSFNASSNPNGIVADIAWSIGTDSTLAVQLAADNDGTIRLTPTLTCGAAWTGVVRYPCLQQCAISPEVDDAHYLVGTANTMLGNTPVDLRHSYGGPWPIPLVDLFAPRAGGGLGIFIADAEPFAKSIEFKHAPGYSRLAIQFDNLSLAAGASVTLPTANLIGHTGDWHETLAAYRKWVRGNYKPAGRLNDAFYCRRDYPLGGTGYLFDAAKREYTPDSAIAESMRAFGAADMIDISGWAYHEKTGRVGDYLENDLGGLDALVPLVKRVHQEGHKVGLYFEGYLIDRRCQLAAKALPAWQLIQRNGKGWWWAGDMEFFACPGVKAWRDELAHMVSTVAAETGVDAVYIDQYGLTATKECWSPDHGHPVPSNPHHEEMAMLQAIREQLAIRAPKTALYVEYTPADAWIGLVDAAFDVSLSENRPGQHVTKLPLYRYVFPEFSPYQMLGHGIRPVPFEVDDLHRSMFHGMGFWMKGRGDSWYTADLLDLARRAAGIYRQHGEVFHSPDCEPLIPTLQRDVYANRFAKDGKTIVTLYNGRRSTVSGDLVRVAATAGARVKDLLNASGGLTGTPGDNGIVVSGSIEPRSTAVVLIEP